MTTRPFTGDPRSGDGAGSGAQDVVVMLADFSFTPPEVAPAGRQMVWSTGVQTPSVGSVAPNEATYTSHGP